MSKAAAISLLAGLSGLALRAFVLPFPEGGAVLDSVQVHSPGAYWSLEAGWLVALCTLPLYVILPVAGVLSRIWPRPDPNRPGSLPPYPAPDEREELFVVLGEVHQESRMLPSPTPRWLTIPADGLYTGIQIIGATGSGKTASAIAPLMWQLFGFKRHDKQRRVGGLVVEVKGSLCAQVRKILREHGREEDLIELGLDGKYCYNPLHQPNVSATALAYQLTMLARSLHGSGGGGDAKFWDLAQEALAAFLIEMFRITEGYVSFWDIYECAANGERMDELMAKAEEIVAKSRSILIDKEVALKLPNKLYQRLGLDDPKQRKWTPSPPHHLKTPYSEELIKLLRDEEVEFSIEEEQGSDELRGMQERLRGHRVFYEEQRSKEGGGNTKWNIAKGVTVFLGQFVLDPKIRAIFSPTKEVYLGGSGEYTPLPPLTDLIETSAIVVLNMPKAADEAVARNIGTALKSAWQRAVELRASRMANEPAGIYRPLAWITDEYQTVATVGGNRPAGDEKFLNLCRESKCVSVMAYQSGSALETAVGSDWKTIFGVGGTKIFLRAGDPWTAKIVSDMAGKQIKGQRHFGFTEGGHKVRVSAATGQLTSGEASVNISTSVNFQKDLVLEPKDVMELPQGVAIVFANDGQAPVEPCFCYLKWFGADPNIGYWSRN